MKNIKIKSKLYVLTGLIALSSMLIGCTNINSKNDSTDINNYKITVRDVKNAQEKWADGLINIGKVYLNKGNYKLAAKNVINNLYAYNYGQNIVLFKPTKAVEDRFRESFDSALSYFIGDNPKYLEDMGFAIAPWKSIKFYNHEIYIHHGLAIAMGKYVFTNYKNESTKVEYTFGYIKDDNNNLKIILHHSSLPYSG